MAVHNTTPVNLSHTPRHRAQDSVRPAAVRRRLALVARFHERHHQRLFALSAFGVAPMLPLMATPLPNVPLYYVVYRVLSHRNAWRGAQAIRAVLRQHAAGQRSAATAVSASV